MAGNRSRLRPTAWFSAEAAHIKPYAEAGPHRIDTRILLRSDLHTRQTGDVTVTPDLRSS
jgi:hypothetical protein